MIRYSVLASGSSGNASLLEVDGFGLLIDCGLSPRMLASRLAAVGASWSRVHAVLLTHTHGDHWNDRVLASLHQHRIRLHCHGDHGQMLEVYSGNYRALREAGLVSHYESDTELFPHSNLRCRPLELSHDSAPTFGFRIDGPDAGWSLGYLSDLGCWSRALAEAVADVDVLALEFNHDVTLERASRRPAVLVQRVLGDRGHLSNDQAAECLRAVQERSRNGGPRHVVQLHLSRECNRPALAQAAVKSLTTAAGAALHTASQHQAGPIITLVSSRYAAPQLVQQSLPGLG